MSDRKLVPQPTSDELIIEYPDDVPNLPDVTEMHASVEPEEPPDTHDIRERWARLAEIGGGA
jgi:hypothetical protein